MRPQIKGWAGYQSLGAFSFELSPVSRHQSSTIVVIIIKAIFRARTDVGSRHKNERRYSSRDARWIACEPYKPHRRSKRHVGRHFKSTRDTERQSSTSRAPETPSIRAALQEHQTSTLRAPEQYERLKRTKLKGRQVKRFERTTVVAK